MMRRRGRPVLGAISGFFFGLLLGLDLLLFGVIALDNVLLTVLPVLGLVLGTALPLAMRRRSARDAADGARPVDAPPTAEAPAPT